MLRSEVREQGLYGGDCSLVVEAPGDKLSMLRARWLFKREPTPEGFHEKFDRRRRRDLRTSNANPVLRRKHALHSPLLDPQATVAVDDSRKIGEELLSRPSKLVRG